MYIQGSHSYWKKPGKMGRHFLVKGKSGNVLLAKMDHSCSFKKLKILENGKNTGKVGEFSLSGKVGSMIFYRLGIKI